MHLELYAQRLVVQVPAGIGVAPPLRRQGSYVLSGPCLYPLRSLEPTGLILIDRGAELRLGQLFALWSQPLGRSKLAGFSGRVAAYLNGRRWTGAPEAIPLTRLTRHAEIALETGGVVIPHRGYRFPGGL